MLSPRKSGLTQFRIALALISLGMVTSYGSYSFFEVGEPEAWYQAKIPSDGSLASVPLETLPSTLYDVRGVGDSAWTHPGGPEDRLPDPPLARFGAALERLDPGSRIFRGHLNFINWESVVGTQCDSIRQQVDFYFLSHPESVAQALRRGFNLFSLSNNHARDCDSGRAFSDSIGRGGPLMTAEAMSGIQATEENPMIWAGVGVRDSDANPYLAKVGTFEIDGRSVRVALAAVSVLGWNIPNASTLNYNDLSETQIRRTLESLRTADADLRILSIHTQDGSNSRGEGPAFQALKSIAAEFIERYDGDVVFGQGPHTWGGVRVFEKPSGRRAVVFTSLGNFLHQGLGSNRDNYLGRALFDRETLSLREVQVYPFRNAKTSVSFYPMHQETKAPRSNFEWSPIQMNRPGAPLSGYSARFR